MAAALSTAVGRAFYGKFSTLYKVQRETIGPILQGLDVIVLSRTGSGKTEAVVAPMVDRYLTAMRDAAGCGLLYVVPTRALANDLFRRLERALEELGLVLGVRHGEHNDLKRTRHPDVLVTTPESLDVMVGAKEPALKTVLAVILDEVHLVYNTQRGFQLAVLIHRLEQMCHRSLQTAGLSATVAKPEDIWAFFRPGHQFETVTDDQPRPIDHHITHASKAVDVATLLNRMGAGRKTKILAFANSRKECDSLGAELRGRTVFGNNVFVHHSAVDRALRQDVERSFLQADSALCVATSTLELGIDIGDVDAVVLYGNPSGWESFLQRVGRGNRRHGKANAVCVVRPECPHPFVEALGFEALVSQIREGKLESETTLTIYGAAVQQVVSMLDGHEDAYVRMSEICGEFADWPHLSECVIGSILSSLADAGYVRPHPVQRRYGAAEELHQLRDHRLIWGNYPQRSREIPVMLGSRALGQVPASNLRRAHRGVVIRFVGRHWRVVRAQWNRIDVEPSDAIDGIEISYSGSMAALDPTCVEQMLRLLTAGVPTSAMSEALRESFSRKAEELRRSVGWDRIPVAMVNGDYIYVTFAGRVVNGVIARWARLSSYDADDLVLRCREPVDFSRVPLEPRDLEREASQEIAVSADLTVFQELLPPEMLEAELTDVWLKTPAYARALARLRSSSLSSVRLSTIAGLC